MKQKIPTKKELFAFLKNNLWTILFTLLFFCLTIPFITSNADHWDMVGHKFSAELQKEMAPNIYFFNPYFFTGVDEFTSYPPLFGWLVILFSYILGFTVAFKFIIILSWISLPFAYTYYARSIQNKRQATIALAIISVYLITTIQHIGTTYISTFLVGNLANALAMPFFLMTIGAVLRKNYKLAIFVAIPVLLSHHIATIMLSIFLLINFFFDKETLKLGFSYGIAAFWLIPAVFSLKANIKTHDDYMLGIIEIALFVLFFAAYYIYTLINKDNKHLNIFFFIFTIFTFEYITLNHFPLVWESIPMHYHRLKIYAYALAAPLFLLIINNIWDKLKEELKLSKSILKHVPRIENWNKTKTTILNTFLIVVLIYLAFFGYSSTELIEDKFIPENITISNARIITVETFEDPVYFNHNQRYALAENENLILKGLFVEASLDSSRIFALEQKLKTNGTIYRWGVDAPLYEVINNGTMRQPAEFYLDLFGAQYLVTKEQVNLTNNYSKTKFGNYSVIKLPQTNLVEVLKYNLSFINTKSPSEWNQYLDEWYKDSSTIVVELNTPITENISPDYLTQGSATLEKQEDNYNKMYISVNSTEIIPVYIKFAYSKNWNAKTISGKKLSVYKATPNNIVVFTNEDFILTYNGFNTYTLIGLIITMLSILLFFTYFENIARLIRKSNF